MNVIVSNKYQAMLETLDIDIIKNLNGEFEVDEIIKSFSNFYFQRMILDITAIKEYKDIKNLQKLSISLDMNKVILLLDDSPESTSAEFLSKLISMGIYNFTKNAEGIMYLYNSPNSYRDVAHLQQLEVEVPVPQNQGATEVIHTTSGARIHGINSMTKEGGATTLAYLMKKELENNYTVAAIEVDKRDFMFFNTKELISTTSNEIGNVIAKNNEYEVLIVDINGSKSAENLCHSIIYLVEPSTIKLNRMMMISSRVLSDLRDKRIVLTKSLLNSTDVSEFEYESGLKVFYNLPPLDDRVSGNPDVNKLLIRLGFDRQQVSE